MHSEILGPVIALVAWTLVVLLVLVVVRVPALGKAGINLSTAKGGRPGGLDGVLPDKTQWPAHNYIHLVEQPTLFYAIAIVLAVMGQGDGINAQIAWAYVGLRVLHSVIQVFWNRIAVRFLVFALSTVALIALVLHAAMGFWHWH